MFRVGINILWQDEANNGRGGKCMRQSNKSLGKDKTGQKRAQQCPYRNACSLGNKKEELDLLYVDAELRCHWNCQGGVGCLV